jgi:hypothetical protein
MKAATSTSIPEISSKIIELADASQGVDLQAKSLETPSSAGIFQWMRYRAFQVPDSRSAEF